MFDSTVLNIAIGLITVFLIYSLFASAVHEALSTILGGRAKTLYAGIESMLTDTPRDRSMGRMVLAFVGNGFAKFAGWIKRFFVPTQYNSLCDKFYSHPIIKNYGSSVLFNKPSYLTPANFSMILVDILKNLDPANKHSTATVPVIEQVLKDDRFKGQIEQEPRDILLFMIKESGGDVAIFKGKIEAWFNDTMDRVSGWYKRNTQFWLFFIGMVLAVSMNVDAIALADKLSRNKAAAAQLAAIGAAAASNPTLKPDTSELTKKSMEAIRQNMDTVNNLLGLGWDSYKKDTPFVKSLFDLGKPCCAARVWAIVPVLGSPVKWRRDIALQIDSIRKDPDSSRRFATVTTRYFVNNDGLYRKWYIWNKLFTSALFGFLITAIAISLGAPFWFDLLNKFVNLRTTGKTVNSSGTVTAANSTSGNDQILG